MADHQNAAPVGGEGSFKLVFRVGVKVIGRLVEDKNVAFSIYELAKSYFCLLAAAKYHHLTFYMFCGKSAFAESGADFILGKARKFLPDFI